jgi:hypothetical protein
VVDIGVVGDIGYIGEHPSVYESFRAAETHFVNENGKAYSLLISSFPSLKTRAWGYLTKIHSCIVSISLEAKQFRDSQLLQNFLDFIVLICMAEVLNSLHWAIVNSHSTLSAAGHISIGLRTQKALSDPNNHLPWARGRRMSRLPQSGHILFSPNPPFCRCLKISNQPDQNIAFLAQ